MSSLNDTIVMAHDRWDGPGAWWPIFPHSGFVIAGVITTIVLVGRRNRRMAGTRSGGEGGGALRRR